MNALYKFTFDIDIEAEVMYKFNLISYNIKFLYSTLSLYRTLRQLACVRLNHVNLT